MPKQETSLQFDLYSLSEKFPVARSMAAFALVGALLVPAEAQATSDLLSSPVTTQPLAIEQE